MGKLCCFPLHGTYFFSVLLLHYLSFCFFMFQSKPNCQCGVGAGGVYVSLHPSPSPHGLCNSDLCAHRNWYRIESPTAGTGTQTQTHTQGLYSRSATGSFMLCVSLSGLHGRKHHVESGWPVDHAAERPFRSTGTREGDTCQQQEGGEILLLVFQCSTQWCNYI